MAVTTTPLSDGGYLESFIDSNNNEHVQKYTAGGDPVGAEFVSPNSRLELTALAGGGFTIDYRQGVIGGVELFGFVFDASAKQINTFQEPTDEEQVTASPAGGFVVTWMSEQSYGGGGREPTLSFFSNTGAAGVSAPLSGSFPASTLLANGDYQFTWTADSGLSHTLEVDPRNPPDLSQPPQPAVSAGDSSFHGSYTNSHTPTLQVSVSQLGDLDVYITPAGRLSVGNPSPAHYAITATDVSRGYMNVPASGASLDDGAWTAHVYATSSNGVVSPETWFGFTVDTAYPSAPTIQTVLDDVGAAQGQVANGGITDDTTPNLRVAIGSDAHVGDIVEITQKIGPLQVDQTITQTDLDRGYVSVTLPALANGHYDLSAHVVDAARNSGPTSPIYTIDVQPDGGGPARYTALSDGGRLYTNIYSDGLHAQKYDASRNPVGPDHLFQGAETNYSHYAAYALAGGAYLVQWSAAAPGGPREEARVVDATSTSVASVAAGGSDFHTTVGPNGGFLFDFGPMGNEVQQYAKSQRFLLMYDNQGHPDFPNRIELAGPIAGVNTDSAGHILINWVDGSTTRTLTLDPTQPSSLTTPPTPAVVAVDDAGPQTGPIANNTTTDDSTPTLHIPVSQPGEIFIRTGQQPGAGIPITDADLARGYMDVTLSASSGSFTGWVRVTDAAGSASEEDFHYFTVQTTASPPPPPAGGQTLQGQSGGSNLQGGAGDDTLTAGTGPDTMTGAGGADHFTFQSVPWQASQVTDFTHGTDKLDLSALLSKAGYSGSSPVADGYVKFLDDGQGNTWLYFDATPATNPWGDYVATLQHVAPATLGEADLIGSTASPPPPAGGQRLQAQDGGSNLVGGSGDDTLVGAHGPDTLTGNAGADHFEFDYVPWRAAQITDYTPGTDKLDLSALLSKAGYAGSDPVADGYVKFLDDGHGDTWLYFDATPATNPWGDYVATIQQVAPGALGNADLVGATASPPPPPPAGVSLQGQSGGSNLQGGTGGDTLIGGTGPDTMSGAGGADHFVYQSLPWAGGEITDFARGVDKLDVSGLLTVVHYAGSDPIADGYVRLYDNGHGGSWLYFDTDGKGTADAWGTFVASLDGVSLGSLSTGDFIFQ